MNIDQQVTNTVLLLGVGRSQSLKGEPAALGDPWGESAIMLFTVTPMGGIFKATNRHLTSIKTHTMGARHLAATCAFENLPHRAFYFVGSETHWCIYYVCAMHTT